MPDQDTLTGAIVGGILAAIVLAAILYATFAKRIERKSLAMLVPVDTVPPHQHPLDSPATLTFVKGVVERHSHQGALARLAEENVEDKGDPVWFSQHVDDIDKWALIVRGRKYELLRAPEGQADGDPELWLRGAHARNVKVTGHYMGHITQCTIENERHVAATSHIYSFPLSSRHYVSLVGWTKKSDEKIGPVFSKIGSLKLATSKNYHRFYRRLASAIIDHKALDWTWLVVSTCSSRDWEQIAAKGMPAVIAKTWMMRMEVLEPQVQPSEAVTLRANVAALKRYCTEKEHEYVTHIIMRKKTTDNPHDPDKTIIPAARYYAPLRDSGEREFRLAAKKPRDSTNEGSLETYDCYNYYEEPRNDG